MCFACCALRAVLHLMAGLVAGLLAVQAAHCLLALTITCLLTCLLAYLHTGCACFGCCAPYASNAIHQGSVCTRQAPRPEAPQMNRAQQINGPSEAKNKDTAEIQAQGAEAGIKALHTL